VSRTATVLRPVRQGTRTPAVRSMVTGLVLVAGVAGWTGLSALHSGGTPGPLAALCLGCAVAWAIGFRSAGTPGAALVPGLVAVAGVVALTLPGFWAGLGLPLGPPLGYANANAALFVQAEVAALMLSALSGRTWQRAAAGALAGLFALMPVLIGSVAGTALAVGVGVTAAAAVRRGGGRWVPAACVLGLGLGLAATVAVGALGAVGTSGPQGPHGPEGSTAHLPARVDRLVAGNRRPVLWAEAFSIMARRPLWGAGPQRFARTAPTALADPDAAWAHNAFLQQGAETGVPGLALVAAVFAWALAQTARAPAATTGSTPPGVRSAGAAVGVIGTAGVAALGVHATVDYVLHFAAVPVAGALLAGFAAGHVRAHGEGAR
jgi:O-antigen ligase